MNFVLSSQLTWNIINNLTAITRHTHRDVWFRITNPFEQLPNLNWIQIWNQIPIILVECLLCASEMFALCCITFGMLARITPNLKEEIGKKIFIKIEYNYSYLGLPYFWRDKQGCSLMGKNLYLKNSVLLKKKIFTSNQCLNFLILFQNKNVF